jgi:hypothetical protein
MSRHDIRTAITILEAVESLSLLSALIVCVEHTVRVIVGIGTAVAILEAIQVFGLRRALIVCIEHAVRIVVWFWATVRVLELIMIFERIRTAIIRCSDTISIRIRTWVHLCVAHQHPTYRAILGLLEHSRAESQSSRHVLARTDSVALILLEDSKPVGSVRLGIELRCTDHGTERACRMQVRAEGVDLLPEVWSDLSNRLSAARTTNQ